MDKSNLIHAIRTFILDSFVPGEKPENLPPELDLIQSGILDSMALVETASFLESLTGIKVEGHELNPLNIGSINAMADFVERKSAQG